MNVSVDGAFIYFTIPVFGGIPVTQTAVSSFVVTALLVIACILLGRNLQKRPTGKQVLVEKGVSMIYNLTVSAMGPHNAHWAPFMGTLFLSSICGSLIGMTGFLRSVTADLSCTLVWAVMVTVLIWYHNIKNQGFFGWLKGFTQPIAVMTPMNIVSEIAQPLSMAFRHYGNVLSGTVISALIAAGLQGLSAIVLGWLPGALGEIPFLQIGIPAVLSVYFDVFSGCLQAYIFAMLTMLYISNAYPGDEVIFKRARKKAARAA